MAINYKKSLKTIKVYIHGMDEPIEVADTTSSSDASAALAEFEKGYKMHLAIENGILIVPYHAVIAVEVSTEASEDITKADPYCEEAETAEPSEPSEP